MCEMFWKTIRLTIGKCNGKYPSQPKAGRVRPADCVSAGFLHWQKLHRRGDRYVFDFMVRPNGESSNSPGPLDTENLFKTLEEWNHHLKAHASLSQTPFA